MGWKGTLRSTGAFLNSMQRESARAAKERDKQIQYENAVYTVQEQQEYLIKIISFHKDVIHHVNWEEIANSQPPTKPIMSNILEHKVLKRLKNPSFLIKLFKKQEKHKKKWERRINDATTKDNKRFENELNRYNENFKNWENKVNLAKSILSKNIEAYSEAFEKYEPCSKIVNIGRSIKIRTDDPMILEVELMAHGDELIPSETYNISKSGKLSVKKTPKSKFYEIYQDYISSAVIRIAREFLAFLPVDRVVVTATGNILNKQTGHLEDQPILSAYFLRETMEQINYDLIDPSESMKNFIHNMDFKKTTGFSPVEKVDIKLI